MYPLLSPSTDTGMRSILETKSPQKDSNPGQFGLKINSPNCRFALVSEEEEVYEGDKGDGDCDHPGLDVDVRGLLSRVLVPVETFTQTNSTPDCVRWVVLRMLHIAGIEAM